ncbi:MAG: hypothetical protein AAFY41_10620, partial [Bacteroidota bacterium]
MKLNRTVFNFICILFSTYTIAQIVDPSTSNYLPNPISRDIIASPTASGITRYADIPVDYYSGKPQISIPIYTLSENDINLPIHLSYHSDAIKVDDIASWVGLNWSLMAGGTITRLTHGLPDELPLGFLDLIKNFNHPVYGLNSTNTNDILDREDATDLYYMNEIYAGRYDTRPDEFHYNFFGYAGKFMFNNEGDFVSIPHNNFKIEFPEAQQTSISGFTITDDKGFIFTFGYGDTELTDVITSDPPMPDMISAWHLQSIQSPTGARMDLSYTAHNVIKYMTRATEYYVDIQGQCNPFLFDAPDQVVINEKNISTIETSGEILNLTLTSDVS